MQQQDASQLEGARMQFLEQQCLLSELQSLLCTLQADKHSDQGLHDVLGTTHGLDAPSAAAVASLAKHLSAASLIQQLQLPDVTAQTNPFNTLHQQQDSSSSSSDAAHRRSEVLGTQQHIAGVTPQQIRQLFIPSRKAAQRTHAPVLPLLERRLKQRAEAAGAAIAGSTDDDPDAPNSAVQKVQDLQAATQQLKQCSMQQLQRLCTEATGYLQELDDIHAVLQQIVGTCMIVEQPKIAQVHREAIKLALDNADSKLRYMQAILAKDTFDQDTIQALRVIKEEQQQLQQDLESNIQQAEADLQEYAQLGGDFEQIVQEYADLQAKLREMDHLMATLTEVEDDIAHARSNYY